MQSFTMTHKDFTINRRQIPRPGEEEEDGIGSKFGQRGWGVGWRQTWRLVGGYEYTSPAPKTHTGPLLLFMITVQSIVYLPKQVRGGYSLRRDASPALAQGSPLNHRCQS